jgi:hypothetical protein
MQLFFNKPSSVSYGIVRYSQWDYVRAGLLRNLETVQNYYYSRIFAVKSNHFLCRLVNNLNLSHNLPLERYYFLADTKSSTLASAMRITSPVQKGALFNGIFFGQDCPEVLVLDSTSVDPNYVYKNWKTAQSVKVVTHPKTDLGLLLPNGKTTSDEIGLAVISINIGMLAVQYRAFATEQLLMHNNTDSGLQGVAHFVHRYVLPNMLPSQLDFSLFNRLTNILNGQVIPKNTKAHPFSMPDYSSFSDQVQTRLIKDMQGKTLEYKAIMRTIPAVSQESMDLVLRIPDNPPTRQIAWSEVLSRIDALGVLIKLGSENSIGTNMMQLNYFASEFKYYQQDKAISSLVPKVLYDDALVKMQNISRLASNVL